MSLRICVPSKGQGRQWIDIYQSSFNEHKRVAVSKYKKAFATGQARLHETRDSGKTVAFSIVEQAGPRILLLSYLAAHPDWRSLGVGSKHMIALLHLIDAEFPDAAALFLEIEYRQETGISRTERLIRQRRARFYERLGFRVWPGEYLAPDLQDPHAEPLRMELMWRPRTTSITDAILVREALTAIYTRAYQLPEDDPLIKRVLEG